MTRYGSFVKQFETAGTQVAFVAGQKKDGLMGAGGYFEQHPLPFPYLLDQPRDVVKAYGVYKPIGIDGINVAQPSTFLVDASGKIRWIYVGRSQFDRPSPEEALRQVASLVSGSR